MECPRCGNTDKRAFHTDNVGSYCRKCIVFGRINVQDALEERTLYQVNKRTKMNLNYSLTKHQQHISKSLIETIMSKQSALVYAACGAGKTEIVMPLIEYCINHNYRIGFAISRREVVLELTERLSNVFPNLNVIPVCEGHTKIDVGDLIICTTHQLYRYHKSFDVLILDEIDAFPYAGNEVLERVAMQSVKKSVVYLTATPDHSLMNRVNQEGLVLFELFSRPHGYPLVVPKAKRLPTLLQLICVLIDIIKLVNEEKPILLFVPTISWTIYLQRILSLRFSTASISSKSLDKEEVMRKFQSGELQILISTTILERGITISDVQVIVLFGDHIVFTESSLIQIVGRVGRKKEFPSGKAIIYCRKKTEAIKNCIKTLERMNKDS